MNILINIDKCTFPLFLNWHTKISLPVYEGLDGGSSKSVVNKILDN